MDKALVITGAAGELGEQTLAHVLDSASVKRVIITTRRRSLQCSDRRCLIVPNLELTSAAGVAKLAALVDGAPPLHWGLVHCAGSFLNPAPLHRVALDVIAHTFASNTLSFLGAVQATLPAMRRVQRGGLVAFTSHTQAAAYPFLGPFNLSKVALLSAVQTLANENARFGVAANAISVATLQTETERRIKPDGAFADWVPARDVAKYAVDLALSSNPAVNGSEIQYWKYSGSFFGQSVFERNSLDLDLLDSSND